MLVYCTAGKTGAYGVELLDKKRKKKIRLEKQWQREGKEMRKGLSQRVRQKGADT